MRVLLVRHATAVSHSACASDDDRWLVAQGRRDARRVGGALADLGLRVDRIYTSPLVRAVQTSEILATAIGYDDAIEASDALSIDRGTTALALAPLENAGANEVLAFVTHEPKIRMLAGHLVGVRSFPGFQTSGACLITIERGRPRGTFEWMLDPATLARATRLEDVRLG